MISLAQSGLMDFDGFGSCLIVLDRVGCGSEETLFSCEPVAF